MTFNAKHLTRLLKEFAEATIDAEYGPAPEHREAIRQYLRQTLVPGWKESREHIFDALDDDVFNGMLTEYAERSWRGYRDAAAHMAGMARTGEVYPLELSAGVLARAFQNTAALLKAHTIVVRETTK